MPLPLGDLLRRRAELLRRLRTFFDRDGYLEVETPAIGSSVVGERYTTPWTAGSFEASGDGRRWFLQPSPEAHMKRLLAAGSGSIYQVCKSFRFGEQGRLHNPEFTMVEWYSVEDDYAAGMDRLDRLLQQVANAPPAERLSYREAFQRELAFDPHATSTAQLADVARARTSVVAVSFDRDGLLNALLAECIEPKLGHDAPTILYDYPASQSALARVLGEPPVARRFEAYWRGVELANGYDELTDAAELARRMEDVDRRRTAEGAKPVGADRRLLAAMERGLPRCVGAALGFDRLEMLALGVDQISEVISFPLDKA